MNLLMAPMNTELCIEKVKPGRGIHQGHGKGAGTGPSNGECCHGDDECKCNQDRHLCNLGFVKGAKIMIVNEVAGNLIVKVKDSKVAIDRGIAKKIIVSSC